MALNDAVEIVRENLYIPFCIPQLRASGSYTRATKPTLHMGMQDSGAMISCMTEATMRAFPAFSRASMLILKLCMVLVATPAAPLAKYDAFPSALARTSSRGPSSCALSASRKARATPLSSASTYLSLFAPALTSAAAASRIAVPKTLLVRGLS